MSPTFTLRRINDLELALLEVLQYSVKVSASDYAKYYFHLRSYCVRLGLTNELESLQPLNLAGAKKLAVLSGHYESAAQAVAVMKRRSASMPEVTETKMGVVLREHSAPALSASLEQVVHKSHTHAGESS